MSVALALQYFLRVWLISVISPRPLSGQTPAKTATDQNKLFSSVSVSPTSPPLPYFFPSLEYRDICSLPPGPRTLLLLYFKREGAGKMCFIVKFVDSKVFLLELCELKLRQCVMSCLSWWRHLKSLCSNLSIYMFDLVGVKRQWLLCILWLLRGMQIDDISWYNNSNRNPLYFWYKQH